MSALLNLIDEALTSQTMNLSDVSESRDISKCSIVAVQANLTLTAAVVKTFVEANVNVGASSFTIATHGYQTGWSVQLSAGGALPDPLLVSTTYYVIRIDANTIKLASSLVNALAGTPITLVDNGDNQTTTVTPATPAVSVQLQQSLDATTWFAVGSPVVPTTTANYLLGNVDPTGKYFRLAFTLTNTTVVSVVRFLGKGLA